MRPDPIVCFDHGLCDDPIDEWATGRGWCDAIEWRPDGHGLCSSVRFDLCNDGPADVLPDDPFDVERCPGCGCIRRRLDPGEGCSGCDAAAIERLRNGLDRERLWTAGIRADAARELAEGGGPFGVPVEARGPA